MSGKLLEPDSGSGASALAAVDRAVDQLRDIQSQATQEQRGVLEGLVAAAIAHEINNILTPARAYAEHALAHLDDQILVRRALERSADGAVRAVRAAEAILELVRGNGPVPRAARISQAVATAQRVVDGVMLSIHGDEACVAEIGAIGLEQVLVNLMLNARAAAESGACEVEIRWGGVEGAKGGGRVWIEVEDRGRGIPSHLLARIFEPLVSHGAGCRTGSGLGLTICRFLVEAVGGSLGVRSQVGVGTCFRIDLPAAGLATARAA